MCQLGAPIESRCLQQVAGSPVKGQIGCLFEVSGFLREEARVTDVYIWNPRVLCAKEPVAVEVLNLPAELTKDLSWSDLLLLSVFSHTYHLPFLVLVSAFAPNVHLLTPRFAHSGECRLARSWTHSGVSVSINPIDRRFLEF